MTHPIPFAAALVVFATLSAGAADAATEIQEVESPGGITAWLVRAPSIPVIALNFAFRGGGALDPQGREGLANMVSGLIDEGAGELDSLAFQTRIEDVAISLSFSADRDGFFGNLRTLSRNRDAAFELMRLALTQPRFDAEPIERIRRQIVVGLTRDQEDPGTVAARTLFKRVFASHPYWHTVNGTIEGVKAIGAEDLKGFVRRRFARDNLVVAAVGDLTPEDLGRLLDRTFGELQANSEPFRIPEAEPVFDGRLRVVRRPVPQSSIYFALPGVKRNDADWYAALVMTHVLGSGQSSRLFEEVREKRGLSYSTYSYLAPFEHAAILAGGAGTQNARVAEALATIRRELERLRDEGISAEELRDAVTYINGSFPLKLTSGPRISRILLGMQLNGLAIDYLEARPGIFEAVTREDVQRVARRLVRPERMVTVVVGDPEGVEDSK